MLTGCCGTRPLDGRRRDWGLGFLSSLSQFLFVRSLSSPTFLEHPCTCVTLDARGHLAWTSLGIISFLRSLRSKFNDKFGLDFIGHHFISSIIAFKVQ